MVLEPWSDHPKVDELDLTDLLQRRTPSQVTKNQEIPLSDVVNFVTEFGYHTGVRKGLALSVNADDTKFDIATGTGIIVNLNPDPLNSTVTRIIKSSATLAIDDLFLSDSFTFVYLDITGTIVQRDTPPETLVDINDLLFLGQLRHFGSVIVTVDDNPIIAQGSTSSHIAEIVFSGGVRLSGANMTANGTDLQLDVTAGILEQVGRGRAVNENSPNESETSAQVPIPAATFFKAYINGTGELNLDNSNNLLDPTMFNEDGLGTLETVANNQFTVVRVFEAAGAEALVFYYGTEEFGSLLDGLASPEPTFTEHADTIQISPIAKIVIRNNVTDLTAAILAGTAAIQSVKRRT